MIRRDEHPITYPGEATCYREADQYIIESRPPKGERSMVPGLKPAGVSEMESIVDRMHDYPRTAIEYRVTHLESGRHYYAVGGWTK